MEPEENNGKRKVNVNPLLEDEEDASIHRQLFSQFNTYLENLPFANLDRMSLPRLLRDPIPEPVATPVYVIPKKLRAAIVAPCIPNWRRAVRDPEQAPLTDKSKSLLDRVNERIDKLTKSIASRAESRGETSNTAPSISETKAKPRKVLLPTPISTCKRNLDTGENTAKEKHNQPQHNQPQQDMPQYNNPHYNQPPYNNPQYNQPRYNNPPYNQSQYNQLPYNQPQFNNPQYNNPQYNQPPHNIPQYNQPPYNHSQYNPSQYMNPQNNQPPYNNPQYNQAPYNQTPYNNHPYNNPQYQQLPYNHTQYNPSQYNNAQQLRHPEAHQISDGHFKLPSYDNYVKFKTQKCGRDNGNGDDELNICRDVNGLSVSQRSETMSDSEINNTMVSDVIL